MERLVCDGNDKMCMKGKGWNDMNDKMYKKWKGKGWDAREMTNCI